MPAKGTQKLVLKSERLCRRRQVGFTDAELLTLKEKAAAAGMTEAKYMRHAILASWGAASAPRPKRRNDDAAIAGLHAVVHHLRKIGGNVNQLAHQANLGLVPLSQAQAGYLKNLLQTGISEATAAMERIGIYSGDASQ